MAAVPETAPLPFFVPLVGPVKGAPHREVDIGPVHRNELVTWPQAIADSFTPEECERIVRQGIDCKPQTGGMYFNVEGYRSVSSQWIMPEGEEAAWLYRRVGEFAVRAARWYQFEVTGFFEPLLFLRYGASDHFDWHLDCGPDGTCTRKLSITIQLTPEDDYEGGNLEFFPQGGSLACRKLGTAIVFPSFYAHRVTPVTRGTRSTLVVWLHGPTFR